VNLQGTLQLYSATMAEQEWCHRQTLSVEALTCSHQVVELLRWRVHLKQQCYILDQTYLEQGLVWREWLMQNDEKQEPEQGLHDGELWQ
jgi:hypothetical protein